MIKDMLIYVWNNIIHNKTRSLLTILSIMIGIMAVFTLMSFGQGLTSYVNKISEDMGTDNLVIQPTGFGPPGSTGTHLSSDDLDFVKRRKDVSDATGYVIRTGEIKKDLKDKPKFVFVMGWSTKPDEIKFATNAFGSFGVAKGRIHRSGDKRKAVLGYNYQFDKKVLDEALDVGDKIYINEVKFEVIGFYEKIGNPQDDSNIYIPLDDANELFDSADTFDMIYLRTQPGVEPDVLKDRLKESLRRFKDQKKGQEDFTVTTLAEQIEVFNNIFKVLNGILVLIAGISVLVAAVNIANTMYTSVLERTKEIGIMKAIGAVNSYILSIFVLESAILGVLGGIFGVLSGYIIASILGNIIGYYGFSFLYPVFPKWLTVSCIIFAGIVGTLSGLFPSRQASGLNPVDALRYE